MPRHGYLTALLIAIALGIGACSGTDQPTRPVPPTTIKVMSHTLTITLVKGYVPCGKVEDAVGCTDFDGGTIRITRGGTIESERQIVMHEVLHAIFDATGTWREVQDDETRAYTISEPLVMVLRDNPELVKYLTAK